jgi:hypothetical protein
VYYIDIDGTIAYGTYSKMARQSKGMDGKGRYP